DYEDEPPIRVLHDLHCEIRTLKEDVNASLDKSCSEKQAVHDFVKASEMLMQRNATDLGKIRELFQKYGYKPRVKDSTAEEEVNSDSTVSVQNKSDEEKEDDVPHLPAHTEKPQVPKDPLHNPQLSDFGLSQYAFSRPWSAVKGQHATYAPQENSKSRTPLKAQSPCILPKTPKCMLKMDDYECVTPKLEHFGISEHTMCLNEDYTMSLIRKAAQASKKLLKKDGCEVNVPEMTSREITVTPVPRPKVTAEKADWMVSPMILVFCTPDVKIPSGTNNTVLSRSPETNELPLANKQNIEDSIPFAVSSDEYLKHFGDPSPPQIKHYDQLLSTPPPPEITRIPDDVLQILSKYNHDVDTSKGKEMETKAGNTRRYESDFTDYCNRENRGYPGFFKPNI
ncbi:Spindle and kinetochore-associated protein 3, partial [Opisthocomus hoazin]